jgi:hypothetical protein
VSLESIVRRVQLLKKIVLMVLTIQLLDKQHVSVVRRGNSATPQQLVLASLLQQIAQSAIIAQLEIQARLTRLNAQQGPIQMTRIWEILLSAHLVHKANSVLRQLQTPPSLRASALLVSTARKAPPSLMKELRFIKLVVRSMVNVQWAISASRAQLLQNLVQQGNMVTLILQLLQQLVKHVQKESTVTKLV